MARTSLQRQQEHDNTCYAKAVARGERTFTLREQDQTASKVILHWIMENWATAPTSKLQDAFEDAIGMRDSTVTKKAAD